MSTNINSEKPLGESNKLLYCIGVFTVDQHNVKFVLLLKFANH